MLGELEAKVGSIKVAFCGGNCKGICDVQEEETYAVGVEADLQVH